MTSKSKRMIEELKMIDEMERNTIMMVYNRWYRKDDIAEAIGAISANAKRIVYEQMNSEEETAGHYKDYPVEFKF